MTALTDDERSLLRAAIREALSGHDALGAAREVLEGGARRDGWPIAVTAGWPGLLLGKRDGGAGLGPPEALLVMRELGHELAGIPLFGHLMATSVLAAAVRENPLESPRGPGGATVAGAGAVSDEVTSAGADADGSDRLPASLLAGLASGERRAAWLPVRPDAGGRLSVDAWPGRRRCSSPRVDPAGRVTGDVAWVPDAPGADILVAAATDPDGRPWIAVVAATGEVEEITSYDPSRRLGHVRLAKAPATLVEAPGGGVERSWALAQALVGAEVLGAAERLLEMSVEHARSRFAFGRAIGSFQAIKHQLVEVLRRLDLARALANHAGGALAVRDPEAYTAAFALRFSAGDALDLASRTAIAVHGGMGATWEHPAALYFRRAQVARRLLGGHAAAATEVGRRLLTAT